MPAEARPRAWWYQIIAEKEGSSVSRGFGLKEQLWYVYPMIMACPGHLDLLDAGAVTGVIPDLSSGPMFIRSSRAAPSSSCTWKLQAGRYWYRSVGMQCLRR